MLMVVAIRGAGALAVFGLAILLARVLGVEEFGRYTFIIGVALFIGAIGQLGSGMALVKLRLDRDQGSRAETHGYYAWHVFISLAGITVLTLLIVLIPADTTNLELGVLLATGGSVFATLMVANFFQSIKRGDIASLPGVVIVPCLMIVIVLLLEVRSADGALLAYIVTAIATAFAFVILFVSVFRGLPPGGDIAIRWRSWSRLSVGFLIAQLGHSLLFTQLPIAYGFVANAGDMGSFSAAYKLATIQLVVFNAIGVYATPFFADYNTISDVVKFRQLVHRVVGASIAFSAPVFLFLLVFPVTLVDAVYGPHYSGAAAVLPILSFGIFIHAASGPFGNLLLMNGEMRYYNIASIMVGGLGILAVILSGRLGGLQAVAWSVTVTLIVWKAAVGIRALRLYRSLTTRRNHGMPSGHSEALP